TDKKSKSNQERKARVLKPLAPTLVWQCVAGLVQSSFVKVKANDGKDNNGKQHQETNLQQRRHSLDDGLQDDLQALRDAKVGSVSGRREGCANVARKV